jgi:hypothetical protein
MIEADYFIIEMNSDRPEGEEDLMDEIVENIVNENFDIEMNASGEILKISGLNNIYDRALKNFDFLDKQSKEDLKVSLEESIGQKAISENLKLIAAFYPDNEVVVGDTWIKSTNEETMSAKYESNCSLEEITDNVYTINMNSDISNNVVVQDNDPMTYLISGIQSGKLKINEQTGWIVEGNIQQQVSGSVKIDVCDEFPEGVECPVTYKSSITYKSID